MHSPDAATPVSYRYTDIFGINTYKFTKEVNYIKGGKVVYANMLMAGRIFPLCEDTSEDQSGCCKSYPAEAVKLSGEDPDSATRDLFNSIANGTFPSWTVYAQIIDPQLAENHTTNIFDAAKSISETGFPLVPFGKIIFNENPVNFLTEVEQAAFSPTSIVPGWSVSLEQLGKRRACSKASKKTL
jgi:catalase